MKKKTYRESLQNNRDNILLSKELVTIHTSVPIEYSIEAMRTQPVDNAACRALFTELEFTTLLKELAPDVGRCGDGVQRRGLRRRIWRRCCRSARAARGGLRGWRWRVEDAQAIAEEVAAEDGRREADPEHRSWSLSRRRRRRCRCLATRTQMRDLRAQCRPWGTRICG